MNVLNTLFVLSPGAYVSKDHRNLIVKVDGEIRIRVPIHGLASLACFGHVLMSPEAMGSSVAAGVHVAFFSRTGRFVARVEGLGRGSLALRRSHLRATEDEEQTRKVARSILGGQSKPANEGQLKTGQRRGLSSGR